MSDNAHGALRRLSSEEFAALALQHVTAESAGDIEATLATFEPDACFELYPCGLRLAGQERIRRYYEYFFATARRRVVDFSDHGQCRGEQSFTIEMSVRVRYADGATRDFRVMTVFPYGETGLRGERIYADDEFFRLNFGPFMAEMEPLAP